GHAPVGGEFAAHHRQHAAVGIREDGVFAGQVRGAAVGLQQRSQSRERAQYVVAGQRSFEHRGGDRQQEVHIGVRNGGDVVGCSVERLIGQAQVHPPSGL